MSLPDAGALRLAQTGAVLVAVNLALLPPLWAAARRAFPGRNVFFARWGFLDVVRVVAAAIAFGFVGGLLLGSVEPPLLRGTAASLLMLGGASALCVAIARRTEPSGGRALGFPRGDVLRASATGLLLYVGILPGFAGLSLLAPAFTQLGGGTWEVQDVLPAFLELGGATRVAVALAVVVVAPLFEEVLFRGFLQPLLVQNLREPAGIGLTSLVFASLHGASMFLPVFGLSLVLGALMLRTRRLAACWFVHGLHNAIVLGLYVAWPELRTVLEPTG